MGRKIMHLFYVALMMGTLTLAGCGSGTEEPQKVEEPKLLEEVQAPEETVPLEEPTVVEEPPVVEEPQPVEEEEPWEETGLSPLHVDGVNLVNEKGDPVQLRGVSTHGIAWFPQYVNRDAFAWLKEQAAVDVVRISMYTSEWGGYCVDTGDREALEALIDEGVQAAVELDLYVIIDWHMLGADSADPEDCNPLHYVEEAKDFFARMSMKYKDYPNVIYEICNEPNNGEHGENYQVTWQDIKSYADQVIPVIRANAENVIVVGTPRWSSDVSSPAKEIGQQDSLSAKYENIMYTFHFYAGSHKDAQRAEVEQALQAGLPIFVTEYGVCDASGNGGIDEDSMVKWFELLDRYGVSYVNWNLSNKAESSAFLNSSCTKINDWKEEDLSQSGQLILREYNNRHFAGN